MVIRKEFRELKLTSVGTVIAERQIRNELGKLKYVVKIGLPKRMRKSTDFYCPIQISSKGSGRVLYSAGIDSVQALQLAMQLIGGTLFRLNRQCEGKLRWDGDENGDLGFPGSKRSKSLM
jgi:hypothetical protein